MQQLRLLDAVQKCFFGDRRIPAVDSSSANTRIIRRFYYTAATREVANIHVDAILDSGNAAQMKRVAGQFVITELVLQ